MGLEQRRAIYSELENLREKPLVVYVTSTRPNASGQIGQDAIAELMTQLQLIPDGAKSLDLLLVSQGGDPTVAWRLVSLIRERVDNFSILIPQAAYSAATLIALGANEIVMHPNGNLGPTDPQIINFQKGISFSAEDVHAFLRFLKKDVGLTDQSPIHDLFLKFCDEVGFASIGRAARGSQLSVTMGEKMLRLHMKDSDDKKQNAHAISEALNTKYFHHGYPVSRKEAREITGLTIAPENLPIEKLMWSIWQDIESELEIRKPFFELELLRADAACANLFGSVMQFHVPPGAPPQMINQLFGIYMQQVGFAGVPPTPFSYVTGLMESIRHASKSVFSGSILAARQLDLNMRINRLPEKAGWQDVEIPPPVGAAAAAQP